MLRFLAGCSAGTDSSRTGRAGRGLGLRGRNERRAEEGGNDKSRDCKFGSHRKVSVGYTVTPNPGVRFRSGAGRTLRKFHIAKKSFAIAAQAFITFLNIRHVANIGFAQNESNSAFAIGGIRNVSQRYEESSLSKMRGHDVIAGHRARKTGF